MMGFTNLVSAIIRMNSSIKPCRSSLDNKEIYVRERFAANYKLQAFACPENRHKNCPASKLLFSFVNSFDSCG